MACSKSLLTSSHFGYNKGPYCPQEECAAR
jgi:hypothetical protein